MTEDDLKRIEAICDKASPGPWEVETDETYHSGFGCTPDGCPGHDTGKGSWVLGPTTQQDSSNLPTEEEYDQACDDAAFIAEARSALPMLVAVYRAQVHRANIFKDQLVEVEAERDKLREHAENMVEALDLTGVVSEPAMDFRSAFPKNGPGDKQEGMTK